MSAIDDSDDVEFEYETIEIGSFTLEITTISHLPIEMLMYNQSKGVEISGQKMWCGSITVIDYVLRNRDVIKDRTVVELGAGTGVLGMICSKIGCSKVILTDNDPRSITHMKQDCLHNTVEAEVKVLDWFSPEIDSLELGEGESLTELRIVAGDVLYKRVLLQPFFATTRILLEGRSQSSMLLCHVPRAGVDHSDVVDEAVKHGLTIQELLCSEEETEYARKYCPMEDTSRAKLYTVFLTS
jgi:predicted nicotinamide N-methyase